MPYHHLPLVSESGLAFARRELGSAFSRILGYYRQDGVASITAIENAMQARNPTAMILPAHSLKGESRQLGVGRLVELAQHLELTARQSVEDRAPLPDALTEHVRSLRPLFQETVALLERILDHEAGTARPRVGLTPQRPVFGRRAS